MPYKKNHIPWNKGYGEYIKGDKNPAWRGGSKEKECLICKKIFLAKPLYIKRGDGKYCSYKCCGISKRNKPLSKKHRENLSKNLKGKQSGKKNSNWKGGRVKLNSGYILIYKPNHPYHNNGKNYVFEHRLVIEKYLKRYLSPKEVVHHINKNRSDNRIRNLVYFINEREHQKFHYSIQPRL